MPVHIVRNDITRMKVDVIVNATRNSLLGEGDGVDGAIHRAAGPQLLQECRRLGGCSTGDAKKTKAYNLLCQYVIHTVGPVWEGGTAGEEELLKNCYRRSLEIARDSKLKSIAFPLISSGAYGYPKAEALHVAMKTIGQFAAENDLPADIYLVVYDSDSFERADGLYGDISSFIDNNYTGSDGVALTDLAAAQRFRHPVCNKSVLFSQRANAEFAALTAPQARDELLDLIHKKSESTFSETLLHLIEHSGMTDVECYRRANVDRRHFSKIRSNRSYQPKKKTAIAFAVALQLPLDETQALLNSAGFTLTHSSRADLIIEFFIKQGNFNIHEINEALFMFDEDSIGG